MRNETQQLENLTRRQRWIWGPVLVVLGVGTWLLAQQNPDSMRAPPAVVFMACFAFVASGMAVALYDAARPTAYRWMMVLALFCLTAIPLWIAFGSGTRVCGSSLPWIPSEMTCRGVFGSGAVISALLLALALKEAFGKR
jgi:hypothetical protein